jgi:UDP-N-acetyl-D-mannosaminuronic acid dehydrogenase
MEIVVVGMGYVGIPVAALFADIEGIHVTGLQRRSNRSGWKIDYLNQGKSPIGGEEPGLSQLLKKVNKKGALQVKEDPRAYGEADVIIITVQTPVDENHNPIYEPLFQVCEDIGKEVKKGVLISLESTVAPGTTKYLVKPILEEKSGLKIGEDFNLVFSYERVMVGRLLHNLTMYPRIVGGYTPECAKRGVKLYQNIVKAEVYPTDVMTAEVAKVIENTYRDVNIASANEMALACESLGVNIYKVREFVNSLPYDPTQPSSNPFRNMHNPGAGVGGHCLPKDPWLLKYGVEKYGKKTVPMRILEESRRLNDFMPLHMRDLIEEAILEKGGKMDDAKITLLGFAFRENSDDPRNTPTLPLYHMLKTQCKDITIHDPYIEEYNEITLIKDLKQAVMDSDCIALVTKHKEYFHLKPRWLKDLMRTPAIVDGRNVYKRDEFLAAGFSYRGIGIPN